MRDGDNHLVVGIEVLGIEFAGGIFDFCAAGIAETGDHFKEFVANDSAAHRVVVEHRFQKRDALLEFFIAGMEVVHFQAGELTQAHVDDSLGLRVGESETFGKLLFGSVRRLGMADNADYLVDIVAGDDQTFENMSLFLCFAQFVFCAPDHHVVAVVDECFYKILEIEQTRTSVDKSHVVDRECRLHCCHLVELVEHHIGVGVLTELDDDAHALVVALVVDVGDAFDFFSLTRSAIYFISSALLTP